MEKLLDMKLRLYIRAIETNNLIIAGLQSSTQRAYRLLPWLIAAIIALAVLPMIARGFQRVPDSLTSGDKRS